MKKLLIISTFLISTLFFINNVSAEEIYVTSDYRSDFYLPDKLTDLGDYENNYNRAYDYYLNNCVGTYDSYYISKNSFGNGYGDNQVTLLCFNSSNNQVSPGLRFGYYSSNKSMFYMQFQIYYSEKKDYSLNYFYDVSSSLTNYNYTGIFKQNLYNYFYLPSGNLKLENGIISTNIDFRLINNSNSPIANSVTEVQGININDTIYNLGDLIYKEGSLVSLNPVPTISITKENEEITTVNDVDYITAINLNVSSNANDEDYICMFSFDERETWDKYSCSEAYAYKAKENKTYYAQVVDRATESVVSSTTFTITDIQIIPSSNPMVDITIEKIEYNNVDFVAGGSCIVNKNNEKYKVCEDLKITFSILDENLFKYQYSYDNKNWNDFEFNILDKSDYSNSMTIRLYQNTTLYVRVINLDNNQLNNSKTFTITQITQIESTNQQVNFQSVYYKELMKIDVYVTFLNYDHTNYNYYFNTSSDKNSFLNITNNITCSIESGCKYKHTFDYSGTVYIRIEDKQGNYINAFTYTVSYEHYLTNKTINDYMSDIPSFMNHFTKYIKSFTNAISYFFNSLNPTIKIAIISLFIVLVACCIIKLGRK